MAEMNSGYTYNTIKCFATDDSTEVVEVPIAHSTRYLDDKVLRTFEDCRGDVYELRTTLDGKLVAYNKPQQNRGN